MKKTIAIILSLVLTLALAACGGGSSADEQMITRPAQADDAAPMVISADPTAAPQEQTEAPAETQAAEAAGLSDYVFEAEGVSLVPGAAFDPAALPQAQSIYQVPSCAIEGTDNVYSYGTFELTAFDDGTQELIYSIYLMDPNITTPEGLALGDSLEKMTELYGEGYTQEGSGYTYTGATSRLEIIAQGDFVASITYFMIVE